MRTPIDVKVTGIILAGGKGTRLGGVDKASLRIGGRTTLQRVRDALTGLVADSVIVVNDDRQIGESDATMIRDPEPHAGVLPALRAALEVAGQPLCVLVACDMPFLNPGLIGRLVAWAEGRDAVLPIVDGRPQPMHAVYRREPCLRAIDDALARGDRRMISFLNGLEVYRPGQAELEPFDPGLHSFFNVNTAQDMAAARAMAGSAGSGAEPRA
jgi:molybdopterin-guanine dinucleotide biosynthesis protein A